MERKKIGFPLVFGELLCYYFDEFKESPQLLYPGVNDGFAFSFIFGG
jgi:hypothetical protein